MKGMGKASPPSRTSSRRARLHSAPGQNLRECSGARREKRAPNAPHGRILDPRSDSTRGQRAVAYVSVSHAVFG